MKAAGLTPAPDGRVIIIPQELGDLLHPAQRTQGLVLNSPHVDLIDVPPEGLTVEQMLRERLGHRILADARQYTLDSSDLSGAVRVQNAIDEVLAWQWAAGDVPDTEVVDWAKILKGHWVSPVTGLPPELIAQLPPDAPDIAARLMMTWLLREKGPDALLTLSAALPDAASWDELYQQAAGLTAEQVEQAAREVMQEAASD